MVKTQLYTLIEERLKKDLEAVDIKIQDQSTLHQGHAAAQGGGHFLVDLASPLFVNKPLIERHRLVYASLAELIRTNQIHALSIKTHLPTA